MDFFEIIKELSDEELEKVVQQKIKDLEMEKLLDEPSEIGYIVDYNPTRFDMSVIDDVKCFDLDINVFYTGYIKKGTKIIFGLFYDDIGNAKNDGCYYYMDDEGYICDFCRYIKDKDVTNEYELFNYILTFLNNYFGIIKDINRHEMFQMIYKDEDNYFPPIEEHSIKSFKGKGNALCSEYSATAQNILCVFGIESYMIIGNQKTDNEKTESHAFNIISFDEKSTKKEVNLLIDFSVPVKVYDMKFNIIDLVPYIAVLDRFDQKFVMDLIYNNEHIISEDYCYVIIGDSIFNMTYDRNRNYSLDNMVYSDELENKNLIKK